MASSDLRGSNFYGTHVESANFGSTSIAHTNWTGAYFGHTNFLGAHDVGTAKLTPSTIGSDGVARFYLFDLVYAHVNGYGQTGGCRDHAEGAISCHGYNDDPNATYGFYTDSGPVEFGWGREHENPRSFYISGNRAVALSGTTNSNFSAFSVTKVENLPGLPTANDAPAGTAGGPLALYLGYHSIFLGNSGYHLNFRGYLQRTGTAPTTAPR